MVVALDAATGTKRWEHAYQAPLVHNGYFDVWLNAAGPGPYSTPLIADGTVFTLGVNGHFHALDLETGRVRWSHDLVSLFKLNDYNAFASSPLAYQRDVILTLGGSRQGAEEGRGGTPAAVGRAAGKRRPTRTDSVRRSRERLYRV